MTFAEFVKKYWGKVRDTGGAWTHQTIVLDSGLPIETVSDWAQWCFVKNGAAGRTLADAELIAAWASEHGEQVTPAPAFGLGRIGDMSVEDFKQLIMDCLKAAK